MNSPGRIRIGLVTPWASRAGGGVFEALAAHCETVRGIGFQPVVIALRNKDDAQDLHRFGEAQVLTVPTAGPRPIGFAPAMARTIREARLDIVHLHGIWMYPSAAASSAARAAARPYVISPHGMLDPWIVSRGRLKKAMARLGYERASWRTASCFHALTDDEAADIQAATGRRDIAVIPNAVEIMPGETVRGMRAAYLGRIHPKKNLAALVEGWRLARDVLEPLGARLDIAGWGEPEHVAELEALLAQDGSGDIAFLGPLFGLEKQEFIGSARFVVLPSHSEGLPMAILEAWAAGTPTLMSSHCHLPKGFEAGAAIDCGTDPRGIASSLRLAFSKPEEGWREMSDRARQIVDRDFTPDVVALHWRKVYSALLDEASHSSRGTSIAGRQGPASTSA